MVYTDSTVKNRPSVDAATRISRIGYYLKRNWILYALMVIPLIYFLVFRYLPMLYIWMAFTDFNIFLPSVFDGEFVGLHWFREAFNRPRFGEAFRNTVVLNLLDLGVGFPAPIILAILLNELAFKRFKRVSQTVLYMPHFISWIIVSGMAVQLFAPTMGLINITLVERWGLLSEPIRFLDVSANWVRTYIGLGVWKSVGWGSIIYLAAITGINQELYEAAEVDGANRLRKIWHVTLPGIRPTIVILLILNLGGMMGIEFDRPWALRNSLVLDRAEVLSTFIFVQGIRQFQFSLAAAIGMFQSAINVVFLVIANFLANKFGESGIW